MTTDNTYTIGTIGIPLAVGSRVTLLEDVDIEKEGEGHTASVLFEDYVEQYVEETGLLRFENSDVGRAEFIEMMQDAGGIEILTSGSRTRSSQQ